MEVEDSMGDYNSENDNLKMNASPDAKFSEPPVVNGISNGFSEVAKEKSEVNGDSQDKYKDKEKERSRDKDKDKDRHKHSSSSSSKHRDHSHSSSSHKSKSKDKDRDRDRDKEKDRDRDKEHKSSSSSSKDKEKSSSSSSSKHHSSSSSSSKDKHKSSSSSSGDKSKHSSSSSDKHRSDKHSSSSDKKHSSSSSSRDKEKSRDDKDKERSKDKDKEKEKSRDKDKERSKDKEKSRDKDKERSRDKDKERSRDKDKERSKDKHKDKSRDKERSKDDHREKRKDDDKTKLYNGEKEKRKSDEGKSNAEHEKMKIKEEPKPEPVKKVYVDDDDDDEDFQPVVKKEIKQENFLEDEDEEEAFKTEESEKEQSVVYNLVQSVKKEPEYEPVKSEASETEDNSLHIDESIKSQEEEDSEDDIPLSKRAPVAAKKRKVEDEDLSDEDVPLSQRKKVKKEPSKKRKKADVEEEEDFKPVKKKAVKKEKVVKKEAPTSPVKGGRKKKEEEEVEVWKWWEEEKKPEGVKWNFLEHKGPIFAPPYEPLPKDVKFYYNGKPMSLSQDAEEVATFYARMIEHEYTTMEAFNTNFFKDWTKTMTSEEKKIITNLEKCNFSEIHKYFQQKSEERKAMSKEEKKALKEENEALQKEYGFCIIDGHKEKIGNFKIEPPGLFRGRGQHPKMGKLKLRVMPEDVLINCSKDSKFPVAPQGHKWKEVRHDNTVTWLASWTENVQGQVKYVMLNPSSKLKGEKDWQKYETARKLAQSVDGIREQYISDWKSKEMRIRQRAVALYFIDKLALRAGNEKDEDQADTVGCCSLRVEHIRLHETHQDNKYVVEFDFPGKDSIRYHNFVPVEKQVFKNLKLFVENKKKGDDLFDRLNTAVLNKHLNELMDGLTAKVFRTYNASITLQNQLNELTDPDASIAEKILQYNRANRAVAILCNHQRSVPKSHDKSMGNLEEKIEKKKEQVAEAEQQVKEAKREAKGGSAHGKMNLDKKKKCLQRLKEQLVKLEVQRTDKDENKTIALGTSKLNYLDPRISVAWCKKYDVPIDKIYNKTQRDKFRWAIDMAGPDYVF